MTTLFTFIGVPLAMAAPAADVCRISGYLTDHLGRPLKKFKVRVNSSDSPIVTSSQGVFGQSADITSDNEGFVQFDAYKGSEIVVVFGSRVEQRRAVAVPDQASIDLFDLVFPYLVSATLSLSAASVAVGESVSATVTGVLSGTTELDITSYCTLESSAPGVARVSGSSLVGVAGGTSNISVTAVDTVLLASSPPSTVRSLFQDERDRVFSRKGAPSVALGGAVALTVS